MQCSKQPHHSSHSSTSLANACSWRAQRARHTRPGFWTRSCCRSKSHSFSIIRTPVCVREAFFEAQSCQWRHFELLAACPLYPKADLCSATRDVRFVPIADIVTQGSWSPHGAANSVGGTVRPNACGAGLSCVRNARRARWSARGKAERKLAALATTKGTIGLWKFIKSLR